MEEEVGQESSRKGQLRKVNRDLVELPSVNGVRAE